MILQTTRIPLLKLEKAYFTLAVLRKGIGSTSVKYGEALDALKGF